MLGDLLGIIPKSSFTLGNKSSALPFKSKVELLIDLGAIGSKNKSKFMKFMEIRNQFAHNISAESFSTCFDSIDGLTVFLKKNYPNARGEKKTDESFFGSLFDELSNDLISLSLSIGKIISERKKAHLSILYKTEAFDVLVFSVENIANIFLNKVPAESPEHVFAKRMKYFVEAAKASLYENVIKRPGSEND